MSRIQQDQFIDEDEEEEVCPLCVEEFDLGDRYFKPCPCGYQICQFCYNNIKTTMNGLCPACRRPYDDKPFSFKQVTQAELLEHQKNRESQQKKRLALKQKEMQKREADNMSRKHLAGLRVRQRNLVYVTGMRPKIQGDRVAELLRGEDYFGQYGEIYKIVVAKGKDAERGGGPPSNQPVGIYVTFVRKEDAASCIEAINGGNWSGDGKIRAQHGTTKYCSAYLRGETCNNPNCMFLHEPGESAESFTRQDLSNMNAISTQRPSAPGESPPPQPPPQHAQPVAAAIQDPTPTSPNVTVSALPAGAGWARRGSRATSSEMDSPVVSNTAPVAQAKDEKDGHSSKGTTSISSPSRPPSSASAPTRKKADKKSSFINLIKTAFDPHMHFTFSTAGLSEEDIKLLDTLPPLWDPQGGAKRRLMKEKEAEELRKRQEAEKESIPTDGPSSETRDAEAGMGGSLQLGGEPEERPERAFGQQTSAIQPPGLGQPFGGLNQQFSSLDNDLATLTLRNMTNQPQNHSQNLLRQFQSAGSGLGHQAGIGGGGHARTNSKFGFDMQGGVKAGQQNKIAGGFGQATNQQMPFYSAAQGPPPGLKTTGTPPVNGSGMFGQGHGFTSAGGMGAAFSQYDARSGLGGQQNQRGAVADKLELPALAALGQLSLDQQQSLASPRRATPTLPPGLDVQQSRRATPTLPPGLFPQLQKEQVGDVTAPVDPLSRGNGPPTSAVVQVQESGSVIASAPTASAQSNNEKPSPSIQQISVPRSVQQDPTPAQSAIATLKAAAKGMDPTPAEMAASVAAKNVDPTPAEMAASRRQPKRTVSKASPVKASTPDLPVDDSSSAKQQVVPSDVKSNATPPPRPTVAKKADAQPSTSKRPHPGKLNLDTTPEANKAEDRKENDSPAPPSATSRADVTRLSRAPSLSAASLSSRPGTPLANVIAASATTSTGSPLKRTAAPRTLRITAETPKTETLPALPDKVATPPPAMPPLPNPLPAKQITMSRRTSIASMSTTNVPGTPITERISDNVSLTSASVSRANSPPPLIARKAKKKREEKEKKREAVEAIEAAKETTPVEVAPIMARKVKKKSKGAMSRAEGPVPVKKEKVEIISAPVQPAQLEKLVVDPPVQSSPPAESAPASAIDKGKAKGTAPPSAPHVPAVEVHITTAQYREKQRQEKLKEEIMSNPLTAQTILSTLDATHQLALSTLNLLKPLTSQSELKKMGLDPFTAGDLQNHIEQLKYELTKADEQLLKQGQAVRKDLGEYDPKSRGRLSGRNMITANGRRLAMLTKEEEDKYLELEQRVGSTGGVGVWGGAGASAFPWQPLKPQQKKLENTLAQADILGALNIATETLEGALRTAARGAGIRVETVPTSGHLAAQGAIPPSHSAARSDPNSQMDPMQDAREVANRFWPRELDSFPEHVGEPYEQMRDFDLRKKKLEGSVEQYDPKTGARKKTYEAPVEVTQDGIIDRAARLPVPPDPSTGSGTAAFSDVTLPPLPSTLPNQGTGASSSTSATDPSTQAAMDTLRDAMATAGAIAKLGANEALSDSQAILKGWDKAMANSSNRQEIEAALEKVVRDGAAKAVKGGAMSIADVARGGAMSMAELEREGLAERVAEARREALEWEKRLNKVVRGNRKAALGHN